MPTLILGGTKSGKSDYGLELLAGVPGPRSIVVTGKCRDLSFRDQIMAHRRSRDPQLAVVEVGTDLAAAVAEVSVIGGSLLVDSLDFWMFALLEQGADLCRARRELTDALRGWNGGALILVSTEMGLGPLAFDGAVRLFARELGQLNREIASVCTSVYLVVAGLPHQLK